MAPKILLGAALIILIVAVFVTGAQPLTLRLAVLVVAVLIALTLAAYLAPAPSAPAGSDERRPPGKPSPPLGRMLDALPVGVVTIGGDGRIGTFNSAAGEIFGVQAARAPGRALIEIVRNSELDRRVVATLRKGGQETSEILHSGVVDRRLQVTTRPLDFAGAQGALVIVTDLTRMRELEKLRQEFVSNVSHELRTPLTAVKLMVETLQTGVEPPARDQFLASISVETERMIALVQDLLDLARLESGKLELRLSTVDVGELCRQVAAAHQTRAEAANIDLVVLTPNPLAISADRDKLYQVLVNLVDNALRHTPAHGSVTLSTRAKNGSIAIEVADSGSGIPSTALPHIFERFYVVDPARVRGSSGTGLGLAIAKHIIEAHGGSIAAESELGVGSVFRCTLPIGLQTRRAVL